MYRYILKANFKWFRFNIMVLIFTMMCCLMYVLCVYILLVEGDEWELWSK